MEDPHGDASHVIETAQTTKTTETTQALFDVPSSGGESATNLSLDQARDYVAKVKNRFLNEPQTFKTFLEILHNYQAEQTPLQMVLEQITALFAGHDDLIDQFKVFLPETKSSAQASPNVYNI